MTSRRGSRQPDGANRSRLRRVAVYLGLVEDPRDRPRLWSRSWWARRGVVVLVGVVGGSLVNVVLKLTG